jgi:hypothetical protein
LIDPSKITFEDDILANIKNFIKKTGVVSDTLFQILPHMEKVFTKNKNCFGDVLMDTLNLYLIYGWERLLNEPNGIEMLLRIGDAAMFTTEPSITVNNSEGAIFLSVMF